MKLQSLEWMRDFYISCSSAASSSMKAISNNVLVNNSLKLTPIIAANLFNIYTYSWNSSSLQLMKAMFNNSDLIPAEQVAVILVPQRNKLDIWRTSISQSSVASSSSSFWPAWPRSKFQSGRVGFVGLLVLWSRTNSHLSCEYLHRYHCINAFLLKI